jgi:hypothetical protein
MRTLESAHCNLSKILEACCNIAGNLLPRWTTAAGPIPFHKMICSRLHAGGKATTHAVLVYVLPNDPAIDASASPTSTESFHCFLP